MVEGGDFREDLMYRINTFEIRLPSLRERPDDVQPLAEHLFRRFRPGLKPNEQLFTPEAIEVLEKHTWPGNVRELANVIEHATILCDHPPISADHLPQRFASRRGPLPKVRITGPITLRDLEMQAIYDALDRHGGNKPEAAEELGIARSAAAGRCRPWGHCPGPPAAAVRAPGCTGWSAAHRAGRGGP